MTTAEMERKYPDAMPKRQRGEIRTSYQVPANREEQQEREKWLTVQEASHLIGMTRNEPETGTPGGQTDRRDQGEKSNRPDTPAVPDSAAGVDPGTEDEDRLPTKGEKQPKGGHGDRRPTPGEGPRGTGKRTVRTGRKELSKGV